MPDSLDRHPRRFSRRAATGLLAATLGAAVLPTAAAPTGVGPHRVRALARGFNLPDWIDGADSEVPLDAVLARLRTEGFGAIRLPLYGEPFGALGQSTALAAARQLEGALATLASHGYAVIVDLHGVAGLGSASALEHGDAEAAAVLAWDTISRVLLGFDADLVFPELLNEPPMEMPVWLALRDRLAEAVRRHCPDHTLIWGAARYQGIWETLDTPLLADPNAMAAVHYYGPMGFTHQCENWSGSVLERFEGVPFPADRSSPEVMALAARLQAAGDVEAFEALTAALAEPWTAAQVAAEFADIGAWSRRHHCPVILNEFGVLDFCAPAPSRTAWVRTVREAAELNGLGWTYWELDHGFGFIEDRRSLAGFDQTMIEALLGEAAA